MKTILLLMLSVGVVYGTSQYNNHRNNWKPRFKHHLTYKISKARGSFCVWKLKVEPKKHFRTTIDKHKCFKIIYPRMWL